MKLRLYLDTSVVSAYVDDRLPERRQATLEFWHRLGNCDVAISEVTMLEVRATVDSTLRERLLSLISGFHVLPTSSAVNDLAREYVRRGVFSPAMAMDAQLRS